MDTRVFNKYSVKETSSLDDSITYLKNMHNVILRSVMTKMRVDGEKFLEFGCDYDQFVSTQKKNNRLTPSYLFYNSLNGVKGLGKESIKWIKEWFPTFNSLYCFQNQEFDKTTMTDKEKDEIRRNPEKGKDTIANFLNGLTNKNQREILYKLFTEEEYS